MESARSTSEPPALPRPPTAPSAGERLTELRDRVADLVDRRGPWRIVAALAVLAGAAAAVWALTRPPDQGPPLEDLLPTVAPLPAAAAVAPTQSVEADIVVHVAGAVMRPGVVEIPADARVADAVAAAGGATDDADLDRINLARVLADADHVHVPAVGEAVVVLDDAAAADAAAPVDLNRADEQALDALPGIGPATAAAIVAHREDHGPFTSVTSLQEVPGIGPAKLEGLRDLVTVGS